MKSWLRRKVDHDDNVLTLLSLSSHVPRILFPVLPIDRLVGVTPVYEVYSFLDSYLGYNQILIDPIGEVKTTFVID